MIVTPDTVLVQCYIRRSSMATSVPAAAVPAATRASLSALVRYFLYLGPFGFGGPIALHAIYDAPTAAIALASLIILWRFKIPEPIVVVAAGAIGLAIFVLRGMA